MLKAAQKALVSAVVLALALGLGAGCGKPKKKSAATKSAASKSAAAKRTGTKPSSANEVGIKLSGGVTLKMVYIKSLDLWVGRYEVRNAEYRVFKPKHSSGAHEGLSLDDEDQPAVRVSWEDAKAFCEFLNQKYGVDENRKYEFRLPTEAEWEVYATCGEKGTYPWGNEPQPPSDWNYFGEENTGFGQRLKGHCDGHKVSAPVQESGANKWGIYGAGGNVWEWCSDSYDGTDKYRTYRGGAWTDSAGLFLKTTRRSYSEPKYADRHIGFRVVAKVSELTAEEKERFAAEKAERERKAAEEKERKEREAAEARERKLQEEADAKTGAERERAEKRQLEKDAIERLIIGRSYVEAGARLAAYAAEFGRDAFYQKTAKALENTKVIDLGEGITLELVRVEPLGIWVGKYEVTNKQMRRFNAEHFSGKFRDYDLDGDDQPTVQVDWEEASAFCKWLTDKFGHTPDGEFRFRLPTESEWTAFARCGQKREFPWGNDWPPRYGNYGKIEDYDDGAVVTCPVGDSGENEWGLFGVGGNVWEWCEDWYDSAGTYHVFRGGAWNLSQPDALRIENRGGDAGNKGNSYVGFRVVMAPAKPGE